MFYIVESSKSFSEVIFDLEPIVQRLGFVILHSHDISEILRRKEIDFDDDCQIFEVCNYRYVEKLLSIDMRLSLSIPWRISVFTENGATKIGLIRPEVWLSAFDQQPDLTRIVHEIEEKLIMIIDEAR